MQTGPAEGWNHGGIWWGMWKLIAKRAREEPAALHTHPNIGDSIQKSVQVMKVYHIWSRLFAEGRRRSPSAPVGPSNSTGQKYVKVKGVEVVP